MGADLEKIEVELDYRFHARDLLERALTHSSRAYEDNARDGEQHENNEQLEFLGDAVLGFLVSEALVSRFPSLSEGRLSRVKARLVSADHLHEVALQLGLGVFLLLGRGEEMNGGRIKRALLANSVEAIIAAIYLDGGYEAAKRFVLERVVGDPVSLAPEEREISDSKGALQELVQKERFPVPRYRTVGSRGPEHDKQFIVEVSVGDRWSARAEGKSKKSASQKAAALLLRQISGDRPPQ